MAKSTNTRRSNYINSLMQRGYSNIEARAIADGKMDKVPLSTRDLKYRGSVDRSYDSPWQDYAETSADL